MESEWKPFIAGAFFVVSSLTLFELGGYLLFALCFVDALLKRSRGLVSELIVLVVYGLLLEILTLKTIATYQYGNFLVMVQNVPITIALGWAAIIYSTIQHTEQLERPVWMRALLAAFLALTVDLSMDAIALREGFWNWLHGGVWFGVSSLNFYSWFVVVFVYVFMRFFWQGIGWSLAKASSAAALLSLAFLLLTDFALFHLLNDTQTFVLVSIIFFLSAWLLRKCFFREFIPRDLSSTLVGLIPLSLHVFFFTLLLRAPYRTAGLLIVASTALVFEMLRVVNRRPHVDN